jgi:chemotaxis protein methyltransferase CheR
VNKPQQGLDPLLSEAIIGTIREPMIVLNGDLRVIVASAAFYEKFKTDYKDSHDKLFYELGNGQWNVPALRTLLEQILPQKKTVEGFEVVHEFEGLGKRDLVINAREIVYENGQRKMLLSIQDVTDRVKLMHQKDMLLKEMRHRIANSLQLIASVILLKATSVQSEESRKHLEDAHDRILSIATVQRNLDPTDDASEVPVVAYLEPTQTQGLCTGTIWHNTFLIWQYIGWN